MSAFWGPWTQCKHLQRLGQDRQTRNYGISTNILTFGEMPWMLEFPNIPFWKPEMSGSFTPHPNAIANEWWESTKSSAFASRARVDFCSRDGHGSGRIWNFPVTALQLVSFLLSSNVSSPYWFLLDPLHLNPWFKVCFWVTRARTLCWPAVGKDGINERRKNGRGGREGGIREEGKKKGKGNAFFVGKQLRDSENSCFAVNNPALDFQLSHLPAV